MRLKGLVGIIFVWIWSDSIIAQTNVRDSSVVAPLISMTYAYQISGLNMNERFGNNSQVGGSFIVKDKRNFVYGVSGGFLFGSKLKESDLLKEVTTERGYVVNDEGVNADVRLYERGYSFQAHVGKQFAVLSPNNNSGPYFMLGIGLLQHKIKIDVVNDDVPQLRDEYLHGYDRLTNGMSVSQTLGYRYLGNSRMTNFFVEVEFLEGFTKSRRSYNIDLMKKDNLDRVDLLTGFRFGWSVPLYKKAPREFYFN